MDILIIQLFLDLNLNVYQGDKKYDSEIFKDSYSMIKYYAEKLGMTQWELCAFNNTYQAKLTDKI